MGALAPDDIPLSRHPAGAQQKSEPRDGIARAHRLPCDGMLVAWALPTHALASPRSERRRSALESLRIVGALLQKENKETLFSFFVSAALQLEFWVRFPFERPRATIPAVRSLKLQDRQTSPRTKGTCPGAVRVSGTG